MIFFADSQLEIKKNYPVQLELRASSYDYVFLGLVHTHPDHRSVTIDGSDSSLNGGKPCCFEAWIDQENAGNYLSAKLPQVNLVHGVLLKLQGHLNIVNFLFKMNSADEKGKNLMIINCLK